MGKEVITSGVFSMGVPVNADEAASRTIDTQNTFITGNTYANITPDTVGDRTLNRIVQGVPSELMHNVNRFLDSDGRTQEIGLVSKLTDREKSRAAMPLHNRGLMLALMSEFRALVGKQGTVGAEIGSRNSISMTYQDKSYIIDLAEPVLVGNNEVFNKIIITRNDRGVRSSARK